MDRGIQAESLVLWQEAEGALTLGRDTVLTYRMSWPQAAGEGRGLRRISRYYDRLAAAHVINHSLSNFDAVCEVAAEEGKIKPEDIERLKKFRANPSDESWITSK